MTFAARRALDAAGAKLSLEAWQALSEADRWALVRAGASDEIDGPSLEAVLARAEPSPERVSAWRAPDSPTRSLLEASDEADLRDLWPHLGRLERYALIKIAESERRSPEGREEGIREALAALRELRDAREPARPELTHLDARGEARMVGVGGKAPSARVAVAEARVRMERSTLELLRSGRAPKGDVLAAARIAGIQAAKRTSELIPLCHIVPLTGAELELTLEESRPGVRIVATARAFDRTGVEMEALVAASVAGLTIYDMLKAVDREMELTDVRLLSKSGGRSGEYRRGES